MYSTCTFVSQICEISGFATLKFSLNNCFLPIRAVCSKVFLLGSTAPSDMVDEQLDIAAGTQAASDGKNICVTV